MIKTSVIIPVYNVEPYIRKCLDSVFAQTQKEIEVIVVNDGSTDGSMNIVNEYEKKNKNLRIIDQDNKGLGAARNVGLREATGKYVYFLDSDDWIIPKTLEMCYQYAEQDSLQVVFFDAQAFWDKDYKIEGPDRGAGYDRRKVILDYNTIYKGYIFFEKYVRLGGLVISVCLQYTEREFLLQNNIFFQEGILHEDLAYTFELTLAVKRLKYLPELLYRRRIRQGSITEDGKKEKRSEGHFAAIEKMLWDVRRLVPNKDKNQELYYMLGLYKCAVSLIDKQYLDDNLPRKAFACLRELVKAIREIGEIGIFYEYELYKIYIQTFGGANKSVIEEYQECKLKVDGSRVNIFKQIPFNEISKSIAVYGTGVCTDRMLEEYKRLVGDIQAKIYYFNTVISEENVTYQGERVYAISELTKFAIDAILISSIKYEEDMNHTIKKLYGDKYKIIRLYDKVKYNFFS